MPRDRIGKSASNRSRPRTIPKSDPLWQIISWAPENVWQAPDDPMLAGSNRTVPLERYREEKAALARLGRLEREPQLVDRAVIDEHLRILARVLRDTGNLRTVRLRKSGGKWLSRRCEHDHD